MNVVIWYLRILTNLYLVRSGYGFAYRRYSKKFVPDEDYARINKIGMWSMEFDYPWDYRKSKKN